MQASDRTLQLALKLTTAAVLLACLVVSLGAFTRLSHAGLGCPDWPGCYGHLTWPSSAEEVASAEARFPESPVEQDKTWPEMVHRYCAGTLGLLVIAITLLIFRAAYRQTDDGPTPPVKHALLICAVIVLQALFGMWTVTLKLWPQVVTAHLLGGFTTLTLIWLLRLRLKALCQGQTAPVPAQRVHKGPLLAALSALAVVVLLQIALGGWTSANYAALACPDLPTCHNQWLPQTDFKAGFNIAQAIGPNYLGGQLEGPARTAIHITHRAGAVLVTGLMLVCLWLLAAVPRLQRHAWGLAGLLTLQVSLGIGNVLLSLPLAIAVAHNGVAALLLMTVLTTLYRLQVPAAVNAPGRAHSSQPNLSQSHIGGARHEPVNQPAV
ncbi:COX15/CtaA family protein [Halioxenophilus sp. WMMB6]|uniref:COX15/CtaA family protein n=1 Tax=Halioxenophilus sp. WMMB6 TaxID=3073815 RepID=UPI00295F3556|nr:COX15/CtaA family protein [Halioxenophilus sp. WMMB6]